MTRVSKTCVLIILFIVDRLQAAEQAFSMRNHALIYVNGKRCEIGARQAGMMLFRLSSARPRFVR